ncbi:hypothetical protein U9R90_32850 [Streptomyces sp. E11-3]|uniref:hypothetical protein n=1 Tax=Streptomyces sp. E11-3 TaxID=3110112 RepID=UPI0039806E45
MSNRPNEVMAYGNGTPTRGRVSGITNGARPATSKGLPCMRLCSALVLCLTAALVPVAPVAAADGGGLVGQPAAECLTAQGGGFPVTTSIESGPDTYHPGEAARNWTVALTNTTDAACDNIHPILVLVDEERTLGPRQPKLEFRERDRWRPVTFEHTDRDENIGVFDDGFPGFTIAPGETVDVPVRLAFAPATRPHQVVAHAALIQRRDDDGDWVGQSEAYEFAIADPEDDAPDGDDRRDSLSGAAHPPTELADTGAGSSPLGLWAIVGAFLVGGGVLVVRARRLARC